MLYKIVTQEREFRTDANLLYHIIMRQAGSIEKAWLEAAMNSVDAGARNIDYKVDTRKTYITDDGKGMDESEIKRYFEVFGLAQDSGERKVYGEFRMGRGQLFAQGRNVWATKDNVINVDVKESIRNKGAIKYYLDKSSEYVEGVKIEVTHYNGLTRHEVEQKTSTFAKWVRYAPARITVNDQVVTRNMKEEFVGGSKHLVETETAMLGLDDEASGLDVYNCGVFVKTLWKQGLGGSINSKHALQVNFARNDIMYSCPVFKKIEQELDDIRVDVLWRKNSSGKPLSSENVTGIVNLMKKDEKVRELFTEAKIFQTASESKVSLNELRQATVSTSQVGDVIADKAYHRSGTIFLDQSQLKEGVSALLDGAGIKVLDYKDAIGDLSLTLLSENVRDKILGLLDDFRLSKDQRYNLGIAQYFVNEAGIGRKVMGAKRTATDGKTFIYLHDDVLGLPPAKFLGVAIPFLIHEATHEDDNVLTDVHGDTYYKKHYENVNKYGPVIVKTINKVSQDLEYQKQTEEGSKEENNTEDQKKSKSLFSKFLFR